MPPGMRAYSMDLRERIVAAVDVGATQPEAAARFGVGLRTVERYLARRRSTGSLAVDRQPGGDRAAAPARARQPGGPPRPLGRTGQRPRPEPKVRQQLQAWLPARLDAAADATLAEHVAAFITAGGQPVSRSAMSRAIAGLPPEPDQALTPGGRRRRAGRPLKQKA